MYELLEKYMRSGSLIAVYSDRNNYESFAVGYVYKICEGKVMILNVGVHGEFDGYSVCFIDDIFRLEENSKYLQKINKLKDWDISNVLKIDTEGELFKAVIETALKYKKIIAIDCCDSEFEVRGYVNEMSDTIVRLMQITEYGEEDGETMIRIDDINKIMIADVECMEIDKLNSLNCSSDRY